MGLRRATHGLQDNRCAYISRNISNGAFLERLKHEIVLMMLTEENDAAEWSPRVDTGKNLKTGSIRENVSKQEKVWLSFLSYRHELLSRSHRVLDKKVVFEKCLKCLAQVLVPYCQREGVVQKIPSFRLFSTLHKSQS